MIKQFFLFRYKTCVNGTQARLLVYASDLEQAVVKTNERMVKDYGPSGPSMLLRAGEGYIVKTFNNPQECDLGIGPGSSLVGSLCRDDSIEYLTDRDQEIGLTHLTPEERKTRGQTLFEQQLDFRFSQLKLEQRDEARRESHSQERRLDIDKDSHNRESQAGISQPEKAVVA